MHSNFCFIAVYWLNPIGRFCHISLLYTICDFILFACSYFENSVFVDFRPCVFNSIILCLWILPFLLFSWVLVLLPPCCGPLKAAILETAHGNVHIPLTTVYETTMRAEEGWDAAVNDCTVVQNMPILSCIVQNISTGKCYCLGKNVIHFTGSCSSTSQFRDRVRGA